MIFCMLSVVRVKMCGFCTLFLGVSPSGGGEIRKCQIERQGDESMDLSEYDRIIRIEYEF